MKIKLKHDEFKSGFAKGAVIGLIVLLLCLEILAFRWAVGSMQVAAVILAIWLLPTFFTYNSIRSNSEKVGFIASHYCVFVLGLVVLLLWMTYR